VNGKGSDPEDRAQKEKRGIGRHSPRRRPSQILPFDVGLGERDWGVRGVKGDDVEEGGKRGKDTRWGRIRQAKGKGLTDISIF